MTIHLDSLQKDAPTSYFCSQCGYRHNKGSIRYHDHWMWRTATPEVLKTNRRKQTGTSMLDILIIVACVGVLMAVLMLNVAVRPSVPEAGVEAANFSPPGMYTWHDDQREVTCYVMSSTAAISCLPDTQKMLWLAKNPTGLPPQTKKEK